MLPRHPAQLYEALAYLFIFIILVILYRTSQLKQKHGGLFGLFLVLVFSARFAIESVKVSQTAYQETLMTAGQWLSVPFLVVGYFLLVRALIKPADAAVK